MADVIGVWPEHTSASWDGVQLLHRFGPLRHRGKDVGKEDSSRFDEIRISLDLNPVEGQASLGKGPLMNTPAACASNPQNTGTSRNPHKAPVAAPRRAG